ncbi:MAG: hypothetical protein ACYDER_08725 [Ktedonobacteraceae bacterium]
MALLLGVFAISPLTTFAASPSTRTQQIIAARSMHTAYGTVEFYNTAKLLALSGTKVVKVTKVVIVHVLSKKHTRHQAPAVDYLYVRSTISWVFLFGHFLCGYGTAEAWTNPWDAEVDEQGDLYVNGNWKGGTVSTDISYTSDETGCWNYGANTLWEMYVSGAAVWFDGSIAYAEVSAFGFQP